MTPAAPSTSFSRSRPARGILKTTLAGALLLTACGRQAPPGAPSLAVIPFENLSPQPDNAYLAEALPDHLAGLLSGAGGIQILGRASALRLGGKVRDRRALGRQLGAGTILEGSIRETPGVLRITAQLERVSDGQRLWTETYTRSPGDIVGIEEAIRRAVPAAMRAPAPGTRRDTDNLAAHTLYLRGRWLQNRRDLPGAAGCFEQAVQKDPGYALAWTSLAEAYAGMATGGLEAPRVMMPKAQAAAGEALKLDDTSGDAHAVAAEIRFYYGWDGPGAEREFRAALESSPDLALAHERYGLMLAATARFPEALAEIQRARALDPLWPDAVAATGQLLLYSGRDEEMPPYANRALELDPNYAFAHVLLGLRLERRQMFGDAATEFQKAVSLSGGSAASLARLGRALALGGDREQRGRVLAILEELKSPKQGRRSAYGVAVVYAGLAEPDLAMGWLENSFREREPEQVLLRIDPTFDLLRKDPRFVQLLSRIGL